MKNKIQLLTLLILICMLISSCTSKNDISTSQKARDNEKQELEQKINDVRSSLINKYNPVVFPPVNFENIRVFTYTLQKLLVGENDKIILFKGFLDDITKEGNDFVLHFTTYLANHYSDDMTVKFHLKSEYDKIKFLIDDPLDSPPDESLFWESQIFLIICHASTVNKIVNYSFQGFAYQGSDEVELELQLPDTFSVSGQLIEITNYPYGE